MLVTTNLFGDILSDVAVAEVGGLGLAPSLNSGEKYAMAQAVHGSAPVILILQFDMLKNHGSLPS